MFSLLFVSFCFVRSVSLRYVAEKKQDGGHGVAAAAAAASRDYSDYVITERWRGIERSYDGNMAILPVWRAWSRVHNEVICE